MNPDEGVVTGSPEPRFKLRLLGFPALSATDGAPVVGLGPGKPLALLAYLSVRREARRDELVDLLWGEVNEANARNAFRQALHRLRTALGEDVIPQDPDRVELAGHGVIVSDRDAFLAHLEAGDTAAALDAYRGDFLEGFELGEQVFDNWVDAERTRLKSRFHSALQQGAESALAAGRWLEALQYVQRLTAVAPFDEAAAMLEANVLVAAGRGPEALGALRRYTQILGDQLDLPPSPRVREMIARIERADHARDAAPAVAKPKETAFVGREPEIARMMSLARGLSTEQGATLLIEGPSGIGKTRLVSEFITRARSLGPLLVLRGRERPTGAGLPYASIAEALRSALRAPGVAGTGRHLLAEASRILPELRDNFDLPEAGPIDAEGGRLRFFEGIAALLDSAAYEQPACVVLDDMQHASTPTLDLVGYLAARLHSSPVLLVLVYRDDAEGAAGLRRIRDDRGGVTDSERLVTMTLGPLGFDAVRELVESIVVSRGVEGQLDIDRVARSAAGHPLRAIELARRALNGEMPPIATIPLRDILWSRLQKASPSQRRVFFAAALLQRGCSLRLLSSAAHLPELATYEAAQELERLGLMSQEGDSYVIAHDFTASFVADASGLAGRALLAGWAADALAAEPAPPNAELANLYSTAGQQAPAFHHAKRAVYDAAALGSGPEVHRMLTMSLALAPDARAREQVELMLAAFGAGKPLLEGPRADAARGIATETPSAASTEPTMPVAPLDPAAPNEPRTPGRRPLFTTRFAAISIVGAVAIVIAVVAQQARRDSGGPRTLRDSLVVIERGNQRDNTAFVVTGPVDDAAERDLGVIVSEDRPAWMEALQLPWIRPSLSPSGTVAVERMTETGTDVYLMNGNGDPPIPIVVGPGTDAILGWSPDGSTLLVRRSRELADRSFDADLWAFRLGPNGSASAYPIDTASTRSVEEEAAWSPDGLRIAWVAQAGSAHQRDVFVSRADGSDIINITEHPAEDYHVSWSSDGNLLAFTSDRDGNPDLFAVEFEVRTRRLWRLTNTPGEEDFATFSPDHRFVAYQSTAGGDAAVYIMPSLGGVAARVTPPGGQYSIAGWRGQPPTSYIDRFRILGPSALSVGDSVRLTLFASDRFGNSRLPDTATVRLLDPSAGEIRATSANGYVLKGIHAGMVRVVASIPGWREDTLAVQVGADPAGVISDDFSSGISADRWTAVGSPRPLAARAGGSFALFPNADMQWQSGLLSRAVVSLTDSVDVRATLNAPFASRPVAGATLALALVEDQAGVDSIAPQPVMIAGVTWDGEASRLTYSVGPQSRSDPVSIIGPGDSHQVRIVASAKGDVSFYVDNRIRWSSSLRFLGAATDRRARIWLGGKATANWGSIRDLVVSTP